jgi:prolyl 4-hydroxylase
MLSQSWRNWVLNNLLKGVDANKLLLTLLEHGFHIDDCKAALGNNIDQNKAYSKDKAFYAKLAQPRLLHNLQAWHGEYLEQNQAQLLRIVHCIDAAMCEELIALARVKLRPSTITEPSSYTNFRTSTTCDLALSHSPVVQTLNQHINDCLGLAIDSGELMQAQHYAIGQQFKGHTDYFEPGTKEYLQYASHHGQRTWTFMLYLNDGCEGGETEFPELKIKIKPQQGSALIWNNLLPNGRPNPLTLHQSHPIVSGEKWVITKWFRDQ